MLTKEQIEQLAFDQYGGITDAFEGIILGATWANDQNYIEIARLEAEKAELIAIAERAVNSISNGYPETALSVLRQTLLKYEKNA